MNDLIQDLRYAVRGLRKSPGFTLVAVLTLALGIGANSAMYSIVNAFLWQRPPVDHPEALVNIFSYSPKDGGYGDLSWADVQDMRRVTGVFDGVAAYYPYPFALAEGGRSERTFGEIVGDDYFTVLGVRAAAGRVFDGTNRDPLIVISHDYWRRHFNQAASAIGRSIHVNGKPFTVAGVAPEGFTGVYYVGFRPDLWVPASQFDAVVAGAPGRLEQRNGPQFRMMARLAPGVSVATAQAAAQTVVARLATEDPSGHGGLEARVMTERDARPEPGIAGPFRLASILFLASVALVLLIACANVANLLLVRAAGRRREIAIRLALGASRSRLVRQLLVESLLLALVGGTCGIAVASWSGTAMSALLNLPSEIPFLFDFSVNTHVLAYTAPLAVLAGLAFGLVPALQAAKPELVGALKHETAATRGLVRSRLRGGLVVAQIAASVVLLVTAGLTVRTLGNLRDVDPGFDTRHGLLMTVSPDLQQFSRARGEAFYRELLSRTRALPEVRAASLAQYVPLDFSNNGGRVFVEGDDRATDARAPRGAGWAMVTPGFFDALGVTLRAGRDFTERDDSAAPGVVIVNETMASRFWPGADPIGLQLRLDSAGAPLVTVVGVARDMKYSNLTEPATPFLYVPLMQRYQGYATLVVRSTGEPRALSRAVGSVITVLEPEMPTDVRTFGDLMSGRALLIPRFAASLAGAFGVLALLIAVIGLYGVVSYAVSQRVREIGIRVALGARPATVARMVVRGGVTQAAIGVGIGMILALVAARALRSLLFGVGTADPITFGAVGLVLGVTAAIASWIPARRAAAVDPMEALRSE